MAAPLLDATGDDVVVSYATDSTFTTLLDIVDVTPPKYTSPEVDTTGITDLADTSQAGRVKASELTITLGYNATQNAALMALQVAQTQLNWKVVIDDSGTATNTSATDNALTGVGYIKDLDPVGQMNRNKKLVSKLTVQMSGTLGLASAT